MRETCEHCLRPTLVCVCAHVRHRSLRWTRVCVLQHPREARVAIGTARYAVQSVEGARLHVGTHWDPSRVTFDAGYEPILLYPGDDATNALDLPPGRRTLVVVDGTWPQAKKVVRESPWLAALPRVALTPPRPSEYRIRREPTPECVSTIEALAWVLAALEGDDSLRDDLLAPFRAMVARQVGFATDARRPRSRARGKPAPIPTPKALSSDGGVCVIAEASAWPIGTPERQAEPFGRLAHVLARRGEELFEAQLEVPLAPETLRHLRVRTWTPTPPTDALAAFRSFVGDAPLVTWGRFTSTLLRREGWTNDTFDLSAVLRERGIGPRDLDDAPNLPRAESRLRHLCRLVDALRRGELRHRAHARTDLHRRTSS